VTSEDTRERIVEDAIRDVWEAENNWEEPLPSGRVVSITTIPQANKTLALDMRVRFEQHNTESQVLIEALEKALPLMKKLFSAPQLNEYDEFRLYGSLPMQDKYGKVREDGICKLFITRNLGKKIQWDNIDWLGFHRLLSSENDDKDCVYWIHGGILSRAKYVTD